MTGDSGKSQETEKGEIAIFRNIRAIYRIFRDKMPLYEIIILYALIPAILAILWFLPETAAWELNLTASSVFASPEIIWKTFISGYLHSSFDHLSKNLGAYWMLMAVIYPLIILANWREEFFVIMAAFLLVVPFSVGALSLKLEVDKTAVGFSGTTSALAGFLIIAIFAAIHEQENGPHPFWAIGPGFLALAGAAGLMTWTTWYLTPAPSLVAGLGLVGLFGTTAMVRRATGSFTDWDQSDYKLLYIVGMSVGFTVWITSFLMLDPRTSTNTLGHFAGYLVGFGMPFLAFGLYPMVTKGLTRVRDGISG